MDALIKDTLSQHKIMLGQNCKLMISHEEMLSRIIKEFVEEAKHFVAEATKCDFDIDVFYNRVTIDAKSILGVLSLDLARVLTVQMNGDNAEFEEYLDTLAPVSTTAA